MDNGKFEIEQVEQKIDSNNFNEDFQIGAVKNEPGEIEIFGKCSSNGSSETDFVDLKHATDSYQEQNEEKLDAKKLNLKDLGHSKVSEGSSTSQFNTVGIKTDDIDIFYEDIKRKTGEEESRKRIGFCKMCYQSMGCETDFINSTAYTSKRCCQEQNESLFYNIHDEDVTLDVKPSFLVSGTDSRLRPLELQHETISGDKVITKEQDSSAAHRGSLKTHETIHTGKKLFHCKVCSKFFTRMDSLKIHERIHNGEKPYNCNTCFKTFKILEELKIHARIHTGEKPFNCKICSKSFSRKSNLKVHERAHIGEKLFHCKICPKSFTRMYCLRIHERSHNGEKPFHCKFCSKSFITMGRLTVHERTHTGEKPFDCKFCSKSFSRMDHLKLHERSHTGDKPFHCKICTKSFSQKSYLKIHERVHTGEKLFHCKTCSKSLTRLGGLKAHERSHTGEKPYLCRICSKTFTDASNLRRHKRTHTKPV